MHLMRSSRDELPPAPSELASLLANLPAIDRAGPNPEAPASGSSDSPFDSPASDGFGRDLRLSVSRGSRSATGFTKPGAHTSANATTRAMYDRQMHQSYDESMVTRGRDRIPGVPSDLQVLEHGRDVTGPGTFPAGGRRGRRSSSAAVPSTMTGSLSSILGSEHADSGVNSHAAANASRRRASLKSLPKDLMQALLANEMHEAKALFMEADEGRKALHAWLAVLAVHKYGAAMRSELARQKKLRREAEERRVMEEKVALPIKNAAVDQIKQFYDEFASLRFDKNRSRVVRMAGVRLMRTIRRLQLRVRGFLKVQEARRTAFNLLWRRVEIRERFAILRCEKMLLAKHKRTHEKDETAKTDWIMEHRRKFNIRRKKAKKVLESGESWREKARAGPSDGGRKKHQRFLSERPSVALRPQKQSAAFLASERQPFVPEDKVFQEEDDTPPQHAQLDLRYTPARRGELIEELFLEKRRAHMDALHMEQNHDTTVRNTIMSRARTQLFLIYSTTKHKEILGRICDEMKETYERLTFGMVDLTDPQNAINSSAIMEVPKKRRGNRIDEAVAKKIQSRLKAACYGTTPHVLFSRWDKDGGGTLDHAEFKKMLRVGLKISKTVLPDKMVKALIHALDDDDNGAMSIAELADFVERGTATFHAGPEEDILGPAWLLPKI